jgi:hypothetical protein
MVEVTQINEDWKMAEQFRAFDDVRITYANFTNRKFVISTGYSCYTTAGAVDRDKLNELTNNFLFKAENATKLLVDFLNSC